MKNAGQDRPASMAPIYSGHDGDAMAGSKPVDQRLFARALILLRFVAQIEE
jgi:hypothetical protein